jgi:hypothetical protein
MTIQHVDIADPFIHEPKGANAAASKTVYVADGAGSGAWGKVPTQGMVGVSGDGSANQIFIVDGAGSHSLAWATAHGFVYFVNIGSPSVITYPSVYTKATPTTIAAGASKEFTEATTARLTYTGTPVRQALVKAIIDLSQATGANRDIRAALYKNGVIVAMSESIISTVTANKNQISLLCSVPCATNDYFEVFVKNDGASGDVTVYTLKLSVEASLN